MIKTVVVILVALALSGCAVPVFVLRCAFAGAACN